MVQNKKTIFIASDHAGVDQKEIVKGIVNNMKGFEIVDLGPNSTQSVDYPDFAKKLSNKVLGTKDSLGILMCGTGIGMSVAANKVKGIRAALCLDKYSAQMAKEHNDANVLVLRAREFNPNRYKTILNAFLKTPFSFDDRHIRRIKMLE